MHLKIALALIRSEKKFKCFRVFIGSQAAPWHTDSKNIYMSIANIVASGLKMRKTSGKLQFLHNCKFPEVFGHFRPLRKIFAMDIYTFLESARQGARHPCHTHLIFPDYPPSFSCGFEDF